MSTNSNDFNILGTTDTQVFGLAKQNDGAGGLRFYTNLCSAVRAFGHMSDAQREDTCIRVFNTQECPGGPAYVDFLDDAALLKLVRLCDQNLWDLDAELRAGRTVSALVEGDEEAMGNPLRKLFV